MQIPQLQSIDKVVFVPRVRVVQVPQMLVVEVVEIPQLQLIEQTVAIHFGIPVVAQRPDHHGSVCPQTIEISQLQSIDKVVFVLVVQVVQVSPVQVVEKTGGSHSCSSSRKSLRSASSRTRSLTCPLLSTTGAYGQTVQKTAVSPQLQFVDEVVDISVVAQMHFPMVLTVQKNIEILQLQYTDKVIDVLVVPVQCPSAGVEKTAELHIAVVELWTRSLTRPLCAATNACSERAENCEGSAVAALFKVVDISVVAQRLIPMVLFVQQTTEIPQLQYIDKVADVLVVHVVQVSQVLSV